MRFFLLINLIIFSFISSVVRGVLEVTSPASGAIFKASGGTVDITIKWGDDGTAPTNDNINSYTFGLFTGSNSNITKVQILSAMSASKFSNESYTATFNSDTAADGLFYIQVYAPLTGGGHVTRYSNRFSLTGMTGTLEPSGNGNPPDGETDYDASAVDTRSFTVPYTLQTGSTRYAPMQLQPGSTISVSTWSRRFPTSSVTYYSTFRSSLDVLSTITPGWSYTMSSLINFATPAPFPSEVGWYAASQKLQSASLDNTMAKIKKKRWVD